MFRKIFSFVTLICLILCFACACSVKKETDDGIILSSNFFENNNTLFEEQEKDKNNSITSKVFLTELTSVGEISYEQFVSKISAQKIIDGQNYFTDGMFPFIYNSKYGYADEYGNLVLEENYKRQANFFSEGKAFVCNGDYDNKSWSVIDMHGNELFQVPDNYANSDSFFRNGRAVLCSTTYNSKTYDFSVIVLDDQLNFSEFTISGGINVDFKIINTPEFAGILTYYNIVHIDENDYSQRSYEHIYALYDINGTQVWKSSIPDSDTDDISSDKLFSALGKKTAYKLKLTTIDSFEVKNGYMNIVNENQKWGLLNIVTGETVIPCTYDYVGTYSDNLISVCKYDKWGYIDINNQTVITPSYKYCNNFVNNRAVVITENNKIEIIDKSGNIISNTNLIANDNVNQIFSFNEITGISVIIRGEDSDCITLLSSEGEILFSKENCSGPFYITNNYVFLDRKMFKIEH